MPDFTKTERDTMSNALATTDTFKAFIGGPWLNRQPGARQLALTQEMLRQEMRADRPRRSVLKRLHSHVTETRRAEEWRSIESVLQ